MRLVRRGDEHALILRCAIANLGEQVVDLPFDRADLNLGIGETGGADDLLDHDAGGLGELIRAGRGRDVDDLSGAAFELLKLQRPVIHRGRKPEAVVHEVLLA